MGYYVNITAADWYIPTDQQDAAYEAVCALNNRNDLKRGGVYPREEGLEQTTTPTPALWFAWMDWNYPETCADLSAVLEMAGFAINDVDKGLAIVGYNDTSGQEDLFLAALAPFAEALCVDNAYVNWQGEEGEMWQNAARDGRLWQQEITAAVHGAPTVFIPRRY